MDNVLDNIEAKQDGQKNDFLDNLPSDIKNGIIDAKIQLLNGEGIAHENVMREVRERFLKG